MFSSFNLRMTIIYSIYQTCFSSVYVLRQSLSLKKIFSPSSSESSIFISLNENEPQSQKYCVMERSWVERWQKTIFRRFYENNSDKQISCLPEEQNHFGNSYCFRMNYAPLFAFNLKKLSTELVNWNQNE